jgi:hypothetical protein
MADGSTGQPTAALRELHRLRMGDGLRDILGKLSLPGVDELAEPEQQAEALTVLRRAAPGLDGLLAEAVQAVADAGGVVIENCTVHSDSLVAVLSAAFGTVDPLGNGIPARLVFDVAPRRTDDGVSAAASSRGTGEFWLHSDSANFPTPHQYVTLACVSVRPGFGGESLLIPADTIVEELASESHRAELELLSEPVYPFLAGHKHSHEVLEAAILSREDGVQCVRYRKETLAGGRKHRTLGARYIEALSVFEETISRPHLVQEFTLGPGDFWVLDNRRWLHGRRNFAIEADRLLKRCKMYIRR